MVYGRVLHRKWLISGLGFKIFIANETKFFCGSLIYLFGFPCFYEVYTLTTPIYILIVIRNLISLCIVFLLLWETWFVLLLIRIFTSLDFDFHYYRNFYSFVNCFYCNKKLDSCCFFIIIRSLIRFCLDFYCYKNFYSFKKCFFIAIRILTRLSNVFFLIVSRILIQFDFYCYKKFDSLTIWYWLLGVFNFQNICMHIFVKSIDFYSWK